MRFTAPCPSPLNFLDRLLTDSGKPYAPIRFKELVKERYLISKNLNTSYKDAGEITPLERRYLLELLVEDAQREKKIFQEQTQNKR